MKKSILFATILLAWALAAHAQTDTMYVMKAGVVVKKYEIHNQIDSLTFHKPTIESSDTVTDYDGNIYKTVTIGSQVWMAENLKTTHYADGSAIPEVVTSLSWENLKETSKAYCWYDNDVANKADYGALYTWAAAMNGANSSKKNPSGIQGVCPTGWHLPSKAEWAQMEKYLIDNGYNFDGRKGDGDRIAKSLASKSGWEKSSVTGAVGNTDYPTYRNKSGFTALPGGQRILYEFNNAGTICCWWQATEDESDSKEASTYWIFSNAVEAGNSYGYKIYGFSVRCVKD
jgi:uncharacterized protein (TIGR02145 family)